SPHLQYIAQWQKPGTQWAHNHNSWLQQSPWESLRKLRAIGWHAISYRCHALPNGINIHERSRGVPAQLHAVDRQYAYCQLPPYVSWLCCVVGYLPDLPEPLG